jgi:hypothetical protein
MATLYSPKIVTAGLVLALDAANPKSYPGSGTTWTDLSNNGNNGTLVNGVGYNSGNLGSLVFDGVDDYVNLETESLLNATLNDDTNWTISYWVNPQTNGRMLDRGNIGTDPTGTLELNVQSVTRNNTTGGSSSLSTDIINTGWNYLALTRTSLLLHSWYLNGTFSNSAQTTESYGGSGIWKIGRRAANTSSIFQGSVSQVSIYNRALTASEIQQNFNAIKARYNL